MSGASLPCGTAAADAPQSPRRLLEAEIVDEEMSGQPSSLGGLREEQALSSEAGRAAAAPGEGRYSKPNFDDMHESTC